MKKTFFLFGILSAMFLISACREDTFEENYTYEIKNARTSDTLDFNGDGYAQSIKLHFTVTLAENVSRRAYGRIYYKYVTASDYSYYASTTEKIVEGGNAENEFEITIGSPNEELPRGEYDFKIELYEKNNASIEASAEPNDTNFAALSKVKLETAQDDKTLDAETWWENLIDETGDGYARSGKLVLDVDCDSNVTKEVRTELYYKISTENDYTLLHDFGSFEITGNSSQDTAAYFIGGENALRHNKYDFKIEIYDAAANRLADMLDADNTAALNDVGFETSYEDVFYYSVKSVAWENAFDNDGDGFARSRNLNFDVDVDKNAVKNVYAKIYFRHPDSTDYSFYDSTATFAITGASASDAQIFEINAEEASLDSAAYDFLISVYEAVNDSVSVFVVSVSSESDSVLKDVKFETPTQDGGK